MDIQTEEFTYKRIVCNKTEFCYFDINLIFDENSAEPKIEIEQFKTTILQALKNLHGQTGAAISVDILKYDLTNKAAILRVPSSDAVKLWSSLTLYSKYQNMDCAFRVNQVSSHLTSLATNSRTYDHK